MLLLLLLMLLLLLLYTLRFVKKLGQNALDVVPARPIVQFAVSKLVASGGLDDGRGRGGGLVVGAVVYGRSRKRLRACPNPSVVRGTLHIARDVREHLLVVLQLLPGSAGAQALNQFVEEEVQMAPARQVVLAQVANGC